MKLIIKIKLFRQTSVHAYMMKIKEGHTVEVVYTKCQFSLHNRPTIDYEQLTRH